MVAEHRFDDAKALTNALATFVKAELARAIASRAQASLVVSGGKTPRALFESLSGAGGARGGALAWDRVWVTLADERWVDPQDPNSNEALVRSTLLKGEAGEARFVALMNDAKTPEAGAEAASAALARIPRPYDLVLLGMGDDGHTASLFPGAPELGLGLAPDAPLCLAVHPPAAPYARLSQSKASLLRSRAIVFLIEGPEKWEAYQRAREPGPIETYPSRAFLLQDEVPVHVYWSR